MKTLLFSLRHNLKKVPRVYVLSNDKKITYGSFSSDNLEEFTGWDALSIDQVIELKQYMHNLRAIINHFDATVLKEHIEFRLRLPMRLIQCVNDVSALALKSELELDIFEPMIASIIQQIKITTAKLPPELKREALTSLDKIERLD